MPSCSLANQEWMVWFCLFFFNITEKASDWSQCTSFGDVEKEGSRLHCSGFLWSIGFPRGLAIFGLGYVILRE